MADAALEAASAVELARLLRAGAVSSVELTSAALERIRARDPLLSAFVTVFTDRALAEARRADSALHRARARGGEVPPFLGVPTGVKDLNLARGGRARFGSRGTRLSLPIDDRTVARLRRAGFVIVGKLATSELGAMPVTEPDVHPPTRNPWDLGRSAGGSSGGSGAAVAGGLLVVAQGSDGAGSIRIPSSFCGLYGLKPSRGRLPNAFGFDDRHLLYTDGALTRTVEDSAALLDVMAGLVEGRPHWAPPPPRRYVELLRGAPPRPLRVRLSLESHLAPVDPEVRAATVRVARLFEQLGHHVEEAPFAEGDSEEFLPIWQRLIRSIPLVDWNKVQPITRWLADGGKGVKPADVHALQLRLAARARDWWADTDVWLSPTTATPAPPIGAFHVAPGDDPARAFHAAAPIGAFTAVFNLTGQPAANLPAGLTANGLPIGVQIAARPFAEALLLQLSRAVEEALPWAQLVAPLAGAHRAPAPAHSP